MSGSVLAPTCVYQVCVYGQVDVGHCLGEWGQSMCQPFGCRLATEEDFHQCRVQFPEVFAGVTFCDILRVTDRSGQGLRVRFKPDGLLVMEVLDLGEVIRLLQVDGHSGVLIVSL